MDGRVGRDHWQVGFILQRGRGECQNGRILIVGDVAHPGGSLSIRLPEWPGLRGTFGADLCSKARERTQWVLLFKALWLRR